MVQVLDRRLTSSFDTFSGQYISSNLRRHLCRKVSGFASSHFVSLQVSYPYNACIALSKCKIYYILHVKTLFWYQILYTKNWNKLLDFLSDFVLISYIKVEAEGNMSLFWNDN